jgi:pimeloyl-ACP methyl ester carboxylesterase
MKGLGAGWMLAVLVAAIHGCTGRDEGSRADRPGLAEGSFTAELGGVAIHYEVHGRGPVLMTVPNSWGLSLQGLRGLYRPLEERLCVVYFDPRGMAGSSPARSEEDLGMAAVREDFHALRAHLGLGRVHVIGWSNGAMNLVELASARPDTLDSAIFVHTVARFTPEDGRAFVEQHPDFVRKVVAFREVVDEPGKSDEEKDALQRHWWLEEYFPMLFADPGTAREKLEAAFGGARFSAAHARHANAETETFDYRERLAAIPVRSLVIAGAHDLMPPERVEEVHHALPDSTYVVLEESGHFGPLEEPEAFRTAVFAFLGVSDPAR